VRGERSILAPPVKRRAVRLAKGRRQMTSGIGRRGGSTRRSARVGGLRVAWFAVLFGAGVACVSLGACNGPSSAAPAPATPEARAAQTPTPHEAYAAIGYRLLWRGFPVMSDGAAPERLDFFGDLIYVHNSRNVVTAMETSNGANRWSNQLGSPISRFVGSARVDDRIVTASDNELFLMSADTGEVLDRQDLALVVNTEPVVAGAIVVFGSTSGEALGHDLYTRHQRWGYQLRGAIEARPTLVGPGVGVVSQRGDVLVIDPNTGASLATHRIFDGLANDPVAGDDTLFVASRDQSVWAFASRENDTVWRLRTQAPITAQPTFWDGLLLVTLPDRGFTAIDGVTGEALWSTEGVEGRAVAVREGNLLVWDGAVMAAMDPDTGDVLERATLPDVAFIAVSRFEDGDMYTMSPAGVVSKLLPK